MFRDCLKIRDADPARPAHGGGKSKGIEAIVCVLVLLFVDGCVIHHKLQYVVAPQASVTPLSIGAGARVALLVSDERPTSDLADFWAYSDIRITMSTERDVSQALAEPLRSGLRSLGFEVLSSHESTPTCLVIRLQSLEYIPPVHGGFFVARATAEVQTSGIRRRYRADDHGQSPPLTRSGQEERINAVVSRLIGKILADLELLAALK